jgi:hypothetical protein
MPGDDKSAARAAVPAAARGGVLAKPLKLVCHDCGQRVFVSREGYQEHNENGRFWAWHLDCRSPWQTSDV